MCECCWKRPIWSMLWRICWHCWYNNMPEYLEEKDPKLTPNAFF